MKPARVHNFGTYFVTTQCWQRRTLFQTTELANLLLDTLQQYRSEGRYDLHEFVIMPNHVHLVLDIRLAPLSQILKQAKGRTAKIANGLLDRTGAFWGPDYFDSLVLGGDHLQRIIRYVENNPVEAHFVGEPRDWLWSSARYRDAYGRLVF